MMKTHKLIVSVLFLCLLMLSCRLGSKQAADKQSVSDRERKPSTDINSPLASVPPGLRLTTFDVDATPPVGNKIAYDSVINTWDMGLRAKGIVILGARQPIVMCAIDWVCISDEGYDAFRKALADAAGTIPERVAVHTIHQHDTPWCDFTIEKILREAGQNASCFEGSFPRELIRRLETAVRNSLDRSQPVTDVGLGSAQVYKVASNRRILGADGKVRATRYTATADSALRAEPDGVIDPIVSLVSFWNADKPIAVLSYYATHPQSYYHTCIPNPDFPGIARFLRQLAVPDALHVHFDGAGGNIGAGKYNDGSHVNRGILAERLADGMKRAWEATKREPVTTESVAWSVEQVALPPAKFLEELKSEELKNAGKDKIEGIVCGLAWLQRCKEGKQIDVTCLGLGRARILHLPGELFVEYQLAAKAMRPDLFVAVAAYGDCGPGYIGTAIAYKQGGYETTPPASNVSPESEVVLMNAISKLLKSKK
jgi:hypothetical protein